MALQPFVGPWLFIFQFLDLLHSRHGSLDGLSARRKAATPTQDSTNTEQTHTNIHASIGIRTKEIPVFEQAKIVQALDRAAAVVTGVLALCPSNFYFRQLSTMRLSNCYLLFILQRHQWHLLWVHRNVKVQTYDHITRNVVTICVYFVV
jgi:hypothetical protein